MAKDRKAKSFSFLVLSPRSDKHVEIVSTSVDSGSVVVDVVRPTESPEGTGGGAHNDAGVFYNAL